MRERIARVISALAVTTLLILSALFARAQNPAEPVPATVPVPAAPLAPAPAPAPAPQPDSLRGKLVYDQNGCARCHSVAGVGNRRSVLDGVGARRDTASIRAWTIGSEMLADSISPATLRSKQGFQRLPENDLKALIAFLASLKEER